MGALVWRDDAGLLRCRRSPGGTQWYISQAEVGTFRLSEATPPAAVAKGKAAKTSKAGEPASADEGGLSVGRTDPETAEAIIKFLVRERG